MPLADADYRPPIPFAHADAVLHRLIDLGDTFIHQGRMYFLAPVTHDDLRVMAEAAAQTEELEDDDPASCEAEDDRLPAYGIGDADDAEPDNDDLCQFEDFQGRDDGAGDPDDAENDVTDFSGGEENGGGATDNARFTSATRSGTFVWPRGR